MASGVRVSEAQFDFSGGVDSGKVPILASELVPTGLKRNQLAWLNNGTVRGGGILQRTGWLQLTTAADGTTLYQGGYLYDDSVHGGNPYLILSVGGHILRVDVEAPFAVTDLSVAFGLFNPPTIDKAYFVQGEEFLVIQNGDYGLGGPVVPGVTDTDGNTLPLIWDGVTLTRSIGIVGNIDPYFGAINELPAGTCMDYYMGRIWIAQGRKFVAGDIVGNQTSGSLAYDFRDSILKFTECPLVIGGDGFSVGADAGDIRAISHAATLDTVLGQGPLFIFTRKVIYKFTVPVTRADWISVTSASKPTLTLAQKKKGTYSDRSVVSLSGDLFYQSPDGIRSLMQAIRYFNQWGNTPISNNEQRVLQFNDRSLMRFSSGIEFDNRLWQTALPVQKTAGVVFQAIIPLDFDLVSSLSEKLPPAWEGMYEGLDHLQLFEGDFGGRDRAFSIIISRETGEIQVWELTDSQRFDQNDKRVQMVTEFPSFTWHDKFQGSAGEVELKQLDGAEIWVDKIYGKVGIDVYYRVDADPCWRFWSALEFCAARTSCEDVNNPVCYPEQAYREGYKFALTLPKPPTPGCATMTGRPTNIGYMFQVKMVGTGWHRIRGLIVHAIPRGKAPFSGMNCNMSTIAARAETRVFVTEQTQQPFETEGGGEVFVPE